MNYYKSILLAGAILGVSLTHIQPAGAAGATTGDVYDAIKSLVKARQMGLPIQGQERAFQSAITAYCANDAAKSEKLIGQIANSLKFEIGNKRKYLTKKFVSASDVNPTSEQGGAVKVWTLLSAKAGDVEWTKAVREILIAPETTWTPSSENVEKGIVVLNGRGTITVDGHTAKIFREDIVAVPPNMPFSIVASGSYPITVLISEAFTDVKGSELAELKPGTKWADPWLKISSETGISETSAKSVFDAASAAMRAAKHNGVAPHDEARTAFGIARTCLAGGNYDGSTALSKIATAWVQRSIKELEQNKALFAKQGVMVANKMTSDVPVFHNDTTPAYMSATKLPFTYHEFVLPFEIVAHNRLGPHQHNTEELYYILNGRGKMLVADPAGERYFDRDQDGLEVNSGTLIAIPSMSLHSIYPVGNASLVHSIAIGSWSDEKLYLYDIEMDVKANPWTPQSWKNAYRPQN